MNKPFVIVTHPLPQAWMEDDQTEFQFLRAGIHTRSHRIIEPIH